MSGSNKILAVIFGVPLLLLSTFLCVSYFLEYKPESVEYALKIRDGGTAFEGGKIKILSWNIGYAGLGKSSDFFLDGGNSSKPENIETVRKNLDEIKKKIKEIDADIIFLQEVDVESQRTFNILQAFEIAKENKEYGSWFATNFRTFFVPVPWYSPMGKIWSGIMTLSRYIFKNEMERYALPESTKLPERLFDLKRCMLVSRMPIDENSRELVLVNLHLSAFDDGNLKGKQLEFVLNFLIDEHKKGNFVIAGGDWNHSMPGIEKEHFGSFTTQEENLKWLGRIDEKMIPQGWKWVFDQNDPSVRSNEKGYVKGENFTTVIDGFLVSPGIRIEGIKTVVSEFEYSDHEPVVVDISVDNN
jgi:endonuclease/exonuclease/phosphatase family metal-dependent hydrolase